VYKEDSPTERLAAPQNEEMLFFPGMQLQAIERIKAFLAYKNLLYQYEEQDQRFILLFQNSDNTPDLRIYVEVKDSYISFSTVYYDEVPDHKTAKVAELIARINVLLIIGHLNFYYENRLVLHQSFMLLYNTPLNNEQLDGYLNSSINLYNEFSPALKRVIDANEEPILAMLDLNLNN
jgi:hypothetical protein